MIYDETEVNELAEKAIVQNDQAAHQKLMEMGYDFQSHMILTVGNEQTRVGSYVGFRVIPHSKEFCYQRSFS